MNPYNTRNQCAPLMLPIAVVASRTIFDAPYCSSGQSYHICMLSKGLQLAIYDCALLPCYVAYEICNAVP